MMTRSRAFKMLLFLLALLVGGAIINVAVAWGCAGLFRSAVSGYQSYDQPGCYVRVIRQPGASFVNAVRHQNMQAILNSNDSTIAFWLMPTALPTSEWRTGRYKMEWRTIDCYGWPLLSMQHESERTLLAHDGTSATHSRRWGLPTRMTRTVTLPRGSFGPVTKTFSVVIPLRPIWLNFTINSIFYAALLWLLFVLPFAFRRRRRNKRNQCAACGYSLRENVSEKCPECGGVVSALRTFVPERPNLSKSGFVWPRVVQKFARFCK